MKTTIQISEELRNELRIIGSLRGMTYEETVRFLIDSFKSKKTTKSRKSDKERVKKHLKSLGYI